MKTCVICGEEFIPSNNAFKTCSEKCSKELKKRTQAKFYAKDSAYKTAQQRRYRIALKKRFVNMLGGRCQNPNCACPNGYSRCLSALEFHHKNPKEKEMRVYQIRPREFERKIRKGEIELFCSNCHKEEEERIRIANRDGT